MQAIDIKKIEGGFAIKFPKPLLEAFKLVFKSARWNPLAVQWEVGPRTGKRLEQWAKEVKEAAEALAAAEEAEMAAQELLALREEIARVKMAINSLVEEKEKLATIRAMLDEEKATIALINSEKEKADESLKEEKRAVIARLKEMCDLEAVRQACIAMSKTHDPSDRVKKARFKEAQQIAVREREILAKAGWGCEAVTYVATANINRPDRDGMKDMPRGAWLNVYRLQQESISEE